MFTTTGPGRQQIQVQPHNPQQQPPPPSSSNIIQHAPTIHLNSCAQSEVLLNIAMSPHIASAHGQHHISHHQQPQQIAIVDRSYLQNMLQESAAHHHQQQQQDHQHQQHLAASVALASVCDSVANSPTCSVNGGTSSLPATPSSQNEGGNGGSGQRRSANGVESFPKKSRSELLREQNQILELQRQGSPRVRQETESGSSDLWLQFRRIHLDGQKTRYVQCFYCMHLYVYLPHYNQGCLKDHSCDEFKG